MLLRILFLIVLVYSFIETPFYKTMLVPEYKKFELKVANLLYGKPETIKAPKRSVLDPDPTPVKRPTTPPESASTETSISNFMPKKSSSSGVKRSMPTKSSKKMIGWNAQN